nr:helix-turn-helix transcriptional regulator [Marinilactibacillus psychrotolerans]
MKKLYREKKIVVNIKPLLKEKYNGMKLRELSRLADVQISALSPLVNNKKKRIDVGHLKRIAEALDITDMNELIKIENIEDDTN